jgi:hypothetical protein
MAKQSSLWDSGVSEGPSESSYTRCYHSHPPLPITTKEGVGYQIFGGSCGYPAHLDAQVYVALQSGSYVGLPQPWEKGFGNIVQVMFPITDGKAPSNVTEFKVMIDWLCNQLREAKKVHVGCIGGHGRTGTVLAAVVHQMMPEVEDPITYVRTHYCEKAVESSEQVAFLVKHYGAKAVLGSRKKRAQEHQDYAQVGWAPPPSTPPSQPKSGAWEFPSKKNKTRFANSKRTIDPCPSMRNIFSAPG